VGKGAPLKELLHTQNLARNAVKLAQTA